MKNMKSRFVLMLLVEIALLFFMFNMVAHSYLYITIAILNATAVNLFLFFGSKKPYSFHMMVNIFILFFFVLANAIQYSCNSVVSSIPVKFDNNDYLWFQFVVSIVIVIFNISYSIANNKEVHVCFDKKKVSYKFLLGVSFFATFMVLLYFRNDLPRLYLRGFQEDIINIGEERDSLVSSLLFDKLVRSIPFVCYVIAANDGVRGRRIVPLLFLMAIALFPTGLSRNAVAMFWLPVLMLSTKIFEKANRFITFVFVGLLVFFPLLDNFRYWSGDFDFELSLNYLNTMNFDSSQEFMVIIKNNIITYGHQLLGVFFFFIPRSIWPSKPIGSGAFVAEKYDVFGNISMPFFAEGFINFGYIGVILFTVLLAKYCSKLDTIYWQPNSSNKLRPYYVFLICASLYILRGDLLSSFAYTTAIMFDILLLSKLLRKNVK